MSADIARAPDNVFILLHGKPRLIMYVPKWALEGEDTQRISVPMAEASAASAAATTHSVAHAAAPEEKYATEALAAETALEPRPSTTAFTPRKWTCSVCAKIYINHIRYEQHVKQQVLEPQHHARLEDICLTWMQCAIEMSATAIKSKS
jgi:hypothetical protein